LLLSQNHTIVSYSFQTNDINFTSDLVYTNSESTFILYNNREGVGKIEKINNEKVITRINDNENDINAVYYTNQKLKYYIESGYSYKEGNVINVLDSVPELDWKIHSSNKKTILGYECVKATANYRGSYVVAYFTSDIPTKFGPYKFDGLPGLILQIYDDSPNYINKFTATEIIFNADNSQIVQLNKDENTISYKEFIIGHEIESQKRINETQKRMQAKLPRDVKVSERTGLQRSGFEKVYEWEEEEKEN